MTAPEQNPDRDPVPLPQAAAQAIRLLRHKVKELESGQRINRKQLIAWLSLAIKELELSSTRSTKQPAIFRGIYWRRSAPK
jgi:hypothetical protein